MITEQQKQELISALEKERDRFFINGLDTTDHDYSIHYLKTGQTQGEHGENQILEACIDDIDCLYRDYCN